MNLALIQELHRQFDPQPSETIKQLREIDFDGIIRTNPSALLREQRFRDTIQTKLGTQFSNTLNLQVDANVILLFIDICAFSTRFGHLSNPQLSSLLDQYYNLVIPTIYKHKGEIDKIIGDGIIAVFGKPFLNMTGNPLFDVAENCAKELITLTKGTQFKSKIALHDGTVMYYRNKTIQYPEYTIIGKPITELHRLESISVDEVVNFYYYSDYGKYASTKSYSYPWSLSAITTISPPLKGVSYTNKRSLVKA